MSNEALKLIVLVLNALHGLISFYGKDYQLLNVDGLYGLRIIEGHLKHILIDLEGGKFPFVPLEIINEVKSLGENASRLANMALPHVYEYDPDYFQKFKYLVHQPWSVMNDHRLVSRNVLWPRGSRIKRGMKEAESDHCIAEVMNAAASMAGDLPKAGKMGKDDRYGCKQMTKPCIEQMLKQKGQIGYSLAHQLLYIEVAELVGCQDTLEEYAKEIGYTNGLEDLTLEFCSNMYFDMEGMIHGSLAKARKRAKYGQLVVENYKQDLFLEMAFVCGQAGFLEFTRRQYLETILTWQLRIGCFTNDEHAKPTQKFDVLFGRRLLEEKALDDSCASHKSAVAAGALTVYLRYLVDPGPEKFNHLRIDAQTSVSRNFRAPYTFWQPPDIWTYTGDTKFIPIERVASFPVTNSLLRDPTFIWFLVIALCFLFATFRVCRRSNLRYARWKGLKWR